MTVLLAAVFAAATVALANRSATPQLRLAQLASPQRAVSTGMGRVSGLIGSPLLAAGLAGLGAGVLLGGWAGLLAGPVIAVVTYRALSRLEPAAVRRRRQRIAADLPLAVDLLVECLSAGRPIGSAASVVAAAVGGPLGEHLELVGARVDLGADPLVVWSELARESGLGPLARAVVRALDTGAPLVDSLTGLGEDLRRERRASAEENARRVAVRSAGPLGLCFLPAFVLVGIVPTVIGAFRGVLT